MNSLQQKLKLNIGTQTKTDSSQLPDIVQKSPRMVLRNLQSTKLRSQEYISTERVREMKDAIVSNHSRQTSLQKMNLSQCKFRINKLANDDNRVCLPNFKKWNKEKAKKMLCDYIKQNNKYSNKIIVKLPEYEKRAPFITEQFSFIEKILPQNQKFRKQLGFSEESILRNNLLLEKMLLERLL
ncbi:unnamed protein product (macronuclear) [Paramecium tetraurelia]|uniref:Chromosome undetermined scaffold_1, whole genome shotgun sequence n=1 Tax=Paramecium tetraurelia TaxID=5888 RepID=Q6BFS5_PARTE|nr:hypothetical protein [Paramecium tetraurelia strain d4-2]XP_001423165.1 uncharacterized protein GSPATT00000202001 [Paramecium tetraurelia]CAH03495.1 hypothetical protein PTMB.297 [Paramecium tetraurelia]CAK55767.1 unnamed protein product [Paramecium tetraurelia]|eukprot:XP_001423165.1 hypothetical protein (macronuclear) [Paramecium tetraurelia strain d4-2]